MSDIKWTYKLSINPSDKRFLSLTTFKNGQGVKLELVSKLFNNVERALKYWGSLGMEVEISDEAQAVIDERAKRGLKA